MNVREVLLSFAGIGKSNVDKYLDEVLKKKKNPTVDEIKTILLNSPHTGELTKADIMYSPCKSIPRAVISKIDRGIKKIIKAETDATIAGSYRRGAVISSDIDILHTVPLNRLIKEFNELGIGKIEKSFVGGKLKNIAYIKMGRKYYKIDFYKTTKKEYPYMLLYLTGSYKFNLIMRFIAKKKGMSLNQYGLYKDEKRIPAKTEKDIFIALNMRWKEPNERQ